MGSDHLLYLGGIEKGGAYDPIWIRILALGGDFGGIRNQKCFLAILATGEFLGHFGDSYMLKLRREDREVFFFPFWFPRKGFFFFFFFYFLFSI